MNNDFISKTLSVEVLYDCFYKVKMSCKNKKKIFEFESNLNSNIVDIYLDIKNNKYTPSSYNAFCIYEPKPRVVMSQEINDKIVNHYITNNILIPVLENKLIDQNVATRKNKGTKRGVYYIEKYLNILNSKNSKIYCLKLDIHKYFYSIDLNFLFEKLNNDLNDDRLVAFIRKLLSKTSEYRVNKVIKRYNYKYNDNIPLYSKDRGLSIGAVICQFLAIYYLNDIDHFIKEKLKCKYYIRYMDDMLIFDYDKDILRIIWKEIKNKLDDVCLSLNNKSNIYNMKNGINFLGLNYIIKNNRLKIRPSNSTIRRIRYNLYNTKRRDVFKYYKSIGSYYGYFSRFKYLERISDFKMDIIDKYNELKKKYPYSLILIRDKDFFDCFGDDARILHFLTNYKLVNKDDIDRCGFGTGAYNKVIEMIVNCNLSYVIVDNNIEFIDSDDKNYNIILNLAVDYLEKENKKKYSFELLNNIIKTNYKEVDNVIKYLEGINKSVIL